MNLKAMTKVFPFKRKLLQKHLISWLKTNCILNENIKNIKSACINYMIYSYKKMKKTNFTQLSSIDAHNYSEYFEIIIFALIIKILGKFFKINYFLN